MCGRVRKREHWVQWDVFLFFFVFVGGRCAHDGHGLDGGITKLDSTLNRMVGRNVDGWDVLTRKEGVDTAMEHAAGEVLHDRLGL